MTERTNRQIVLARRPEGRLEPGHFRATVAAVPEPGAGELLCRTILLSIDPANRAWMQGPTYRDQVREGDVMAGFTLAEVMRERGTGVAPGTVVACEAGWQEWAAIRADRARPIRVRGPLSHHLSVLGVTGLTAWFGLADIGRPRAGETVLVSAAAGATGNVVGQLARLAGARVVGITGSDAKNRMLERDLRFDATVNHRSATLRQDVAARCPRGVDVYFDNVGGRVLEAVLPLMNLHGRIVCCGAVSQYDTASAPPGPSGVPGMLVVKRLRMEGFIVLDAVARWPEAEADLAAKVASGGLQVIEEVIDGLDSAPAALIGLLAGENVGKRMVRVGPDPGERA